MAHIVAKTYVARHHDKKEVTLKREFSWFEKAMAKIESTGQQLWEEQQMWLAMRLIEAGFDFDIAILMMRDIFGAKRMGESKHLKDEAMKSMEVYNKAKREAREIQKERKELGRQRKEIEQLLRTMKDERKRLLMEQEEMLRVGDKGLKERENFLRHTAGEEKNLIKVFVSLLLLLILSVLCEIDFMNRKMRLLQSSLSQVPQLLKIHTEPPQPNKGLISILAQMQKPATKLM